MVMQNNALDRVRASGKVWKFK